MGEQIILEADGEYLTFVIRRRPPPPAPPPFVCALCNQKREPDPWSRDQEVEPICSSCERHWGNIKRSSKVSRIDDRNLNRFAAVLNRLDWEIMNGRRYRSC